MHTFGAPQASGPSDLKRTDSARSNKTVSSTRRPSAKHGSTRTSSTKPASLHLTSTTKPSTQTPESKSTTSSILDSLNRKLDRFLDDIRDHGYTFRGSKYLKEAEELKSLPPTPCSGKSLELTYLIPKPLSSNVSVDRRGSPRKIANPAETWKRIGSSEYRFV